MKSKPKPWLLVWVRYLLVLAIVFILSLGRRVKPALVAVWRVFYAVGSLPFGLMNEIADMQMRRVAADVERATHYAQLAQQSNELMQQMALQQQAMLQNAFVQWYAGQQSNMTPQMLQTLYGSGLSNSSPLDT